MMVPRNRPPSARIVPLSSPLRSSACSSSVRRPSRLSMSITAVRVGFSSARSTIKSDSGNSAAAHRKNAADETSPGTSASIASSRCPPVMPARFSARRSFAPNASQRHLGVIPRRQRLLDPGFALGKQAGQQHRRFHLRAGHRRLVFDRLQSRRHESAAARSHRAIRCARPFVPAVRSRGASAGATARRRPPFRC